MYVKLKSTLTNEQLEKLREGEMSTEIERLMHKNSRILYIENKLSELAEVHNVPVDYFEYSRKIVESLGNKCFIALTVDADCSVSTKRIVFDEEYTPKIEAYRFTQIDYIEGIAKDFVTLLDTNSVIYPEKAYIPELDVIVPTTKLELASLPDTRKLTNPWSETITRSITIDNSKLMEDLRVRYAFFTPPRAGLLNIVLDSFVPALMYRANMFPNTMQRIFKPPRTAVAISPWFASMLGVKQVPLTDLIAILGYTEKQIRALFKKVRAKKIKLILVGYGGTSINTITWLSELSKLANTPQIFKSIKIYEHDFIEVSNLLRFPLDPRQSIKSYSEGYIGTALKTDLVSTDIHRLTADALVRNIYYRPTNQPTRTQANHIIYGAPDIATRAELSKNGNFISATHANQSCRIDLNPAQNTELQVESYGVISLATFFMNQLKMALSFIELLASDQDLTEQDKTILEYSFDGIAKGKPSRQYNFQLEHTGMLLTEEEAINNV